MPSGTKISLEKRALLAYHFNGVKSTWEFVADNLFLPNEISRLTIKRLWCCMEEWKEEQFDAFIRGDNPASESSSLIARGSTEEDVLTDVDDGQQDAVRFKCRPKGSALASKALTITAMKTAMERKIQLEIEVVEDCGAGGKYKAETWLGVKQIDDYDSPTNPSTFVVEIVQLVGLASTKSKTRLRFQHFEIQPESDNDAIELESDNDAIALED